MLKTIPPTTNCGCGYFKSKCAEIHYQTSSFSILCIFCGLKTLDLHDFIDHFHKIHFEDFKNSIQCTNEPTVSHITDSGPKAKNRNTHHDPLEFGDREIVDDPEEQMKILKEDCEKLEVKSLKHEKEEDSDDDYFGDKDVSGGFGRNDTNEDEDDVDDFKMSCKVKLEPPEGNSPLKTKKEKDDDDDDGDDGAANSNDDGEKNDSWQCSKTREKIKQTVTRKERNQPLICSHCGREFKRSYQLAYHMNIHTGAKPFQCEVCGKQFKARTTLTRHLTTHEERPAYVCEFCDKRFTHKAAMLSHQLRHTQVRSFKCDECERLFYTSNQVETHKRKMHASDDASLPFVCDMCGKRYRTASMLSTHRHKKHFAHAPFSCDRCEKKFIDEPQLEIHKTIHTDQYTLNH